LLKLLTKCSLRTSTFSESDVISWSLTDSVGIVLLLVLFCG